MAYVPSRGLSGLGDVEEGVDMLGKVHTMRTRTGANKPIESKWRNSVKVKSNSSEESSKMWLLTSEAVIQLIICAEGDKNLR